MALKKQTFVIYLKLFLSNLQKVPLPILRPYSYTRPPPGLQISLCFSASISASYSFACAPSSPLLAGDA